MLGSRYQQIGSRKRKLHGQERMREADVLPSRPHCPGVPGNPGHGKAGAGSDLGSSEYCREEKDDFRYQYCCKSSDIIYRREGGMT